MKKFVIILFILILSTTLFVACDSTRPFSDEIYLTDFTGTHVFLLDVNVRKHSAWPDVSHSFIYGKDLNTLYEKLKKDPNNGTVSFDYDRNFISVTQIDNGKDYSCIIYFDDEIEKYVIHSMSYAIEKENEYLGIIYFPIYALEGVPVQVSSSTLSEENYPCLWSIERLQEFYKSHGYFAEIGEDGKTLNVIAFHAYPSTSWNVDTINPDGKNTVGWSVIFDDNRIHFDNLIFEFPTK